MPLRSLLLPLSWPYSLAVRLRNRRFDRGEGVQHAAAPVISIGNVTTGGTGKTPLVMRVVEMLTRRGRRPAILTRGYAAAAGQTADEVLEYQTALPNARVVVNADRVAGAREALEARGADCLVLDDGFQHRRLARDLDIVLVDALDPWGGGRLLPAGNLREPLTALRRADLIIITRANQVDEYALEFIEQRLHSLAPRAPVVPATVEPTVIYADEAPREVNELGFCVVLPVCGIGNPASFVKLVDDLAGYVAPAVRFRDHHRYADRDVEKIRRAAERWEADLVLTTRKDWVKLAPLWQQADGALPALARLDIRLIVHDPDGALDAALTRALEAGR